MNGSDKILTAIIDDDEEFVFALKEHLGFFPEIQLQGTASKYNQAKNLLLKEDLELVFMDIEMPVKTGFELLEEARKSRKQLFSVIFYTAFDKYLLQGLRESAFDYIMKPVTTEDLRTVIDRYKAKRKSEQQVNSIPVSPCPPKIIPRISCIETPNSIEMNDTYLDVSRIPAIPTTLFLGKPVAFNAKYVITSKGLETTI